MVALPNIDPSYGTELSQEFKVKRVEFQGYSQRKRDGLNAAPQQWSLIWENISDAESETLRAFFEGLGGVDTIDWTPYNQAAPLKFTANKFRSRPTGYKTATVSIQLTQEFDL